MLNDDNEEITDLGMLVDHGEGDTTVSATVRVKMTVVVEFDLNVEGTVTEFAKGSGLNDIDESAFLLSADKDIENGLMNNFIGTNHSNATVEEIIMVDSREFEIEDEDVEVDCGRFGILTR